MSFYSIHYLRIQSHSYVIGEHFIHCFFSPRDFLLIFDIIDSSIIEGLNVNIPHIIIAYCRIHPFLDQSP